MRYLFFILITTLFLADEGWSREILRGSGAGGGACSSTTDSVLDGVGSGTTEQNGLTIDINMAQAVTLNAGEVITGYQLMVQGTSYGTGSLFISLWTDSSGAPGAVISGTTATMLYSALNGEAREQEELLLSTTYTVSATGTYHIVIGGVGGDAGYGIYKNSSTLGASNYTTDGGVEWYLLADDDFRVEVLGCN